MRNLFGLALGAGIVFLCGGEAFAQSGPGGGPAPRGGAPGPPPPPPFAFLDADGNGLISKAEFTAGMQLLRDAHEAFRTADANRDGALDGTEYQSGGFTTPLAALDTDGDGDVSIHEFMDWVIQ